MALVRHSQDPAPLLATGRWDGRIMETPAGSGGFGYDPLFRVPGHDCSSAELPVAVKNRLSHRGQALSEMMEQMDFF
jgi:XTP/dITP diphosphohydrolase